jgi:hypothetical protein
MLEAVAEIPQLVLLRLVVLAVVRLVLLVILELNLLLQPLTQVVVAVALVVQMVAPGQTV